MVKTILFDVDGVLLSEERYFDASGLTVWEIIHSDHYLGLAPDQFKTVYRDEEINRIREQVFVQDEVLKLLKSRGLNANWDMIYLTLSDQLIHLLTQIKEDEAGQIEKWLTAEINYDTIAEMKAVFSKYELTLDFTMFLEDFKHTTETKQGLLKVLDNIVFDKLGVKTDIFSRKGALWSVGEHASQEWYVGDKYILSSTGKPSVQPGKKGFLEEEIPLAKPEEIKALFSNIRSKGIALGVGTGRPQLETFGPFKALGWLEFFQENHIATADEVLKAETELQSDLPLAKPNPFTYLLSLKGTETSAQEIVHTELPLKNGKDILIVGDSLADLLAAQKMGCLFAGILTGLSGQEARAEFEEHGADYILDSVLDVQTII